MLFVTPKVPTFASIVSRNKNLERVCLPCRRVVERAHTACPSRARRQQASLTQRARGAPPRSNRRRGGRGRTIGDTRLARQFQAISFLDACFVLIQGFPFGVSLGRGQGAFEHVFLWFCFFFLRFHGIYGGIVAFHGLLYLVGFCAILLVLPMIQFPVILAVISL